MNGKGSKRRTGENTQQFRENFDKIFRKEEIQSEKEEHTTEIRDAVEVPQIQI